MSESGESMSEGGEWYTGDTRTTRGERKRCTVKLVPMLNGPSIADLLVEEQPKHFECPLCLNIMEQAMVLTACGHSVCRSCADKNNKRDPRCPVCRTKPCRSKPMQPNWFARQVIGELKIRCPFGVYKETTTGNWTSFDGDTLSLNSYSRAEPLWSDACQPCTEVFSVTERASHEATCLYTIVRCPFRAQGCMYAGMRKDLDAHRAQCKPCPKCNERIAPEVGWAGHQEVCAMVEVCCPWERHGCAAFRGLRRDLGHHLDNCKFQAVAKTLQGMEERIAHLSTSNAQLAQQCEQLALKGGGADTDMVFVRGFSGPTKVVAVNLEGDTGEALYVKLERIYGLPPGAFLLVSQHRVVVRGPVLLSAHGVRAESTLSMRPRPHALASPTPCVTRKRRRTE